MIVSASLKSFVRSSAIFTAASILVNLLGYVFHIFAGRYLGPASYSDITSIIAYATILSVPVTVASVVIIRRVGSFPDKRGYLKALRNYCISLTHAYSIILPLYGVLIIIGLLNRLSLTTSLMMPAFVLTYVFAQLYAILLQAGKLFSPLSFAIVIAGILKVSGALLTPFFPSAIPILLFLIISNLVQIYLSLRYLNVELKTATSAKEPVTYLWNDPTLKLVFLSILGLTLINNIDIVLAKQFLSSAEAGIYGLWSLFAKAITYTFIPLSSVALVFFAERDQEHNPRHILFLSLAFLSLTTLAAYVVFKRLAPFMVTTLMGSEFDALIPILPSAALFGGGFSLIYLLNNYALARSSTLAYVPLPAALIMVLGLGVWGSRLEAFSQINTIFIAGVLGIYLTLISRAKLARTKSASFPPLP